MSTGQQATTWCFFCKQYTESYCNGNGVRCAKCNKTAEEQRAKRTGGSK